MSSTFAELGVSPAVIAALEARDVVAPFAIQNEAIPPAIEGRDVCGKAPTGSGKTLAFGIPIVERVGQAAARRPRALILAPTRELASQIARELRPLLAVRDRRVAVVFGGVGFTPQIDKLRRGVDVLVACPGRLADLIKRGDVELSDVDLVVLDEADRMADMGFLPEVRRLLDQTNPQRQTLLFSATLDGDVDVLVRRYQRSPVVCEVQPPDDGEANGERVTHRFIETTRADRPELTAKLILEHGPTVVFSRTKHGADRLARVLGRHGVTAVAIHGNRSQGQRERALRDFTSGDAQALVATDVAARGIHVDDVACVVHFDLPADAKSYIHRSGRTGRAGAEGLVVAFVTEDDGAAATKLRRELAAVTGETPPPSAKPRVAKGSGKPAGKPSGNADHRRKRRRGPRNPASARSGRR